jgi:hypothetical protein
MCRRVATETDRRRAPSTDKILCLDLFSHCIRHRIPSGKARRIGGGRSIMIIKVETPRHPMPLI